MDDVSLSLVKLEKVINVGVERSIRLFFFFNHAKHIITVLAGRAAVVITMTRVLGHLPLAAFVLLLTPIRVNDLIEKSGINFVFIWIEGHLIQIILVVCG